MHTFNETCMSFCPFGNGDIQRAVDVLNEMGCEESLYDLCEEYTSEIGMRIADLDPVAVVYEWALNTFKREFEDNYGVDVLNDISGDFYVAANYLCTTFDYSSEWKSAVEELIEDNEEKEWSTCSKWVFDQLEIDIGE